jgi:hypothetical protein
LADHQLGWRLETLKAIAKNDYVLTLKEGVNNKIIPYDGVVTEGSAPEVARDNQFHKGEYLAVKGAEKTANELENKLAGLAIGQVLPEVKTFTYVGGPNTTALMWQ